MSVGLSGGEARWVEINAQPIGLRSPGDTPLPPPYRSGQEKERDDRAPEEYPLDSHAIGQAAPGRHREGCVCLVFPIPLHAARSTMAAAKGRCVCVCVCVWRDSSGLGREARTHGEMGRSCLNSPSGAQWTGVGSYLGCRSEVYEVGLTAIQMGLRALLGQHECGVSRTGTEAPPTPLGWRALPASGGTQCVMAQGGWGK